MAAMKTSAEFNRLVAASVSEWMYPRSLTLAATICSHP
jgi:hypothetical protein